MSRRSTTPRPPPAPLSAYSALSDAEIDRLIAEFDPTLLPEEGGGASCASYAGDPVRYMQERLKIRLWKKQIEIVEAMQVHQRVLVRACHAVGKTYIIAAYLLYHYEALKPSISLSTAPTGDQVKDLLWKQMRVLAPAGLPFMPAMPWLQDPHHPMHYAKGLTTRTEHAFQGRHEEKLLIAFDEACGVHRMFWKGAEGMLTGNPTDTSIVAIFNPSDTNSVAYENDRSTTWHSIGMSALEHPNILCELVGLPAPFPKAVRLSFITSKVIDPRWCTPLARGDRHLATDLEWPPQSGNWYRPGADFEVKVLGRWPTKSISSVWSDAAWDGAATRVLPEPTNLLPQVGCDVARFGDDLTTMHTRRGPCSLSHEAHQGFSITDTAGRCIELAGQLGRRAGCDGRAVPIAIDDTGVGGGVTDILESQGYNVIPINAQDQALDAELYPNRRSELWFVTAERGMEGRLDTSRLSAEDRDTLRRQIMAPKWRLDSSGRRAVEDKDKTKKRLGRSPDDADGYNLAFAAAPGMAVATTAGAGPVRVGSTPGSGPSPAGASTPPATPAGAPGSSALLLESDEPDDAARGGGDAPAAASSAPADADPWLVAVGKRAGDPRLALLSLMGYRIGEGR